MTRYFNLKLLWVFVLSALCVPQQGFTLPSDNLIIIVRITDLNPPQGILTINNADAYTRSTSVNLNLAASDAESEVTQICFSNDRLAWTEPEAYAISKAWQLGAGDGNKTVYAKFKDAAGNWSPVVSDTIILDTQSPQVISSWPAKDSFVGSQGEPITLNIVFADATSGIDLTNIRLLDTSGNDITVQAQVSENNIEFLIANPTDKRYSFSLYLEDKAGNNTLQVFNFTVDSTIPKVSANIMGGEFSEPFTVKLQCSESANIYYSTDGYPPIEGAANTTAVKGSFANVAIDKTTHLQFFAMDDAGNRSVTKTETYFFNELPPAVSGVQVFYNESEKKVELQWSYIASINGYYVYRALNIQEINLLKDSNTRKYAAPSRLRISASLVPDNLFYDASVLSSATYWYGVSVVDAQGVESPVSELVSIKIPDQPPLIDRKEAARRALVWIEANQKPQGYWGEKKETRMLATSQILNALYRVYYPTIRQSNIWVWRGLFWLRGNFSDNNDYMARKIATLRNFNYNVDEEGNRLLGESLQSFDNNNNIFYGWGVQKRYNNDAFTSGLGFQALLKWKLDIQTVRNLYDRCIIFERILSSSLTSSDGHFGWVSGKDASIFVSALLYSAINQTKWATTYATLDKNVYQWILDSQKSDGSFGNGVIDTAGVLCYLYNYIDYSVKTNAISYLVSRQDPNGSWLNNDAYVTGLCLEAIFPHYWSGDWNAPW